MKSTRRGRGSKRKLLDNNSELQSLRVAEVASQNEACSSDSAVKSRGRVTRLRERNNELGVQPPASKGQLARKGAHRRGSQRKRREQLGENVVCPLDMLSEDTLDLIRSNLDAKSLARLSACCRGQGMKGRFHGGLRPCERIAMEKLVQLDGVEYAERWEEVERSTWIKRLYWEETFSGFDQRICGSQGFHFSLDSKNQVSGIKLEGIGPKLLVSSQSTHDAPFLRWRMQLRGNNAVEFGVIPATMQDQPKVLHKVQKGPNGERPTGFCSSITVGSMLPVKLPLMKNSVIEILATRSRLRWIVTNPLDGVEMTWHNSITIPKPYVGPQEFKLAVKLNPDHCMRLAVTCWQRAAFDILPMLPGSLPLHQQRVLAQGEGSSTSVHEPVAGTSNQAAVEGAQPQAAFSIAHAPM